LFQSAGVPPNKAFIDPGLCLISKIIVNSGNYDDQTVAGICGLADKSGIVCSLAALNVTDHHAPPFPRAVVRRVPHAVEDAACNLFGGGYDIMGKTFVLEEFLVTVPVVGFDKAGGTSVVRPWTVILVGYYGSYAHADANAFFQFAGQ